MLTITQLGQGRGWMWTQVSLSPKPILFPELGVCQGCVLLIFLFNNKYLRSFYFGIENGIPPRSNILVCKMLSLVWELSVDTGDDSVT